MSSSPHDLDDEDKKLRERVLFALRHQIRPAEEVDAVRRQMARNLARSLGKEQLASPLALVDADATDPDQLPPPSDDLSPKQRELVEAVRSNVELRAKFARMREAHAKAAAAEEEQRKRDEEYERDSAELLRLQLRAAALQDLVDRRKVAIRHLEQLRRQPAAAPDFLDPEVVFRGCGPLPEMPRELMDSFTIDRGALRARAQELFQRIKKENLRQKILARQQERQAQEARARFANADPAAAALHPEAHLRALKAVKDHLIGWIETHLSKAGGDGDDDDDEPSFVVESPEKKREPPRRAEEEKRENNNKNKIKDYDYDAQLAEVQKEYDRHVELRKEIMALMACHDKMAREWSRILREEQGEKEKQQQQQQEEEEKKNPGEPVSSKEKPTQQQQQQPPATGTPGASLITPYIEKLQAIARAQKSLVQEKSHINATLARHQQETREVLGHLADESQLLARFPSASAAASAAAQPGASVSSDFGEATKGAGAKKQTTTSLAAQLEPWLLAADAAKLATLETVAEKVEEGQMAVDEAMAALDEARKVLGREEGEEGDGTEGEEGAGEQHVSGGAHAAEKGKSIYAKLDGNLGLINE